MLAIGIAYSAIKTNWLKFWNKYGLKRAQIF